MRIYDIDPGYLNRQSLLGEHAEIHATMEIIRHDRKGFASHPEVHRWRGHLPALKRRHDAVAAEMERRGFHHRSPMPVIAGDDEAPEPLQPPKEQFALLRRKYAGKEQGRLKLPEL